MWEKGTESNWGELADGMLLEVKEWRERHPKATLREIEEAVDRLMAKARAQLIQDVALASGARKLGLEGEGNRPRCPQCGEGLQSRGEGVRVLCTSQDQTIELRRGRGVCPACGTGIFPPG